VAAPSIRESSVFSSPSAFASVKPQKEDHYTPSKKSTMFYLPTNTPERPHMAHAAAGAVQLHVAAAWGGSTTPLQYSTASLHGGGVGFGQH